MKFRLLICFCFISTLARAQVVITGRLSDEKQAPVSGASVVYKKKGTINILGFGHTDNQGMFRLQVKPIDTDSLLLEFNHISHEKKTITVANRTANYEYMLRHQAKQLEEVQVTNPPIYKRMDTINYSVGAFTAKQDRVIADIIRKLPGIEMQGDQILYQGKPIQKYMVNNLDLMEGRYAMINNNLPADAVLKVQVVENDQPVKVLDSLVFSERASLNLELKKFISTGFGKAGLGAAPLLWDINLTPMTFSKTFQMLNSFQTNNTGYDAAKDLRTFYTGGNYISADASVEDGPSYLSVRNVTSPGFDERKWLNNRLFMLSTNMLKKFATGIELKGNVSYYHDTRKRRGFTATQFFTPADVIYSTEDVDNRYKKQVMDVGLLIEKNEKDVYLRNVLKYHKRWDSDHGNLLFNHRDAILQRRAYTDEALVNALSLSRFIGKQLVSYTATIEYRQTPQRLFVLPGQFQDLLNNGDQFDQLGQIVHHKEFSFNNSAGFIRKIKYWTFHPAVSLNYNSSRLDSYVTVTGNDTTVKLGREYLNAMNNSQLQLAWNLRIGWENKNWKLYLAAPYSLYYYNVKQQGNKTLDNDLRHTFNPSTGLTYLLNASNELSASVSGGQRFGGLNQFYNGYIISQYRNMQRYDARLLRTDSRNLRLAYNYKNTSKASFGNLTYSYSNDNRDYIFSTTIDSLGRTTTAIKDLNGKNTSHSITGGVSRFFPHIKSIVKLNGSLRWGRSDYLLNGIMEVQRSSGQSASFEIINNLNTVISGEYKSVFGHTKNVLSARVQDVYFNNHYLNLIFTPVDDHSLTAGNSLYINNIPGQKMQYFLDIGYRYHAAKWKTDIELTGQNLLNNNQFIQQYSSNIELVQSYFELRPRQFLLSARFKF